MPILIVILLALVIAQIGFWDTIGAIFGAVLALVIFIALVVAIIALVAYLLYRRVRRRF